MSVLPSPETGRTTRESNATTIAAVRRRCTQPWSVHPAATPPRLSNRRRVRNASVSSVLSPIGSRTHKCKYVRNCFGEFGNITALFKHLQSITGYYTLLTFDYQQNLIVRPNSLRTPQRSVFRQATRKGANRSRCTKRRRPPASNSTTRQSRNPVRVRRRIRDICPRRCAGL